MATKLENKQRNILIPIDSSVHAERSFDWYLANLAKPRDHVFFIHVVEPVYTSATLVPNIEAVAAPQMECSMEQYVQKGKELCQRFKEKAKTAGVDNGAFIHLDTKPGHALVEAAKDNKVDMIVMGNRGIGKVRRTFMGSVSDYVVHHAHRPVLVIPPPPTA